MRIEPDISNASVVLLGRFNPAIFTPAWFVLHELLPKPVADRHDLQVAHDQIVAFSTDWLRVEARPDRFQVETQQAPYIRLHDLVIRLFEEHLFHTPVRAFGINRDVHFRAPSRGAWNAVGRLIAPLSPWEGLSDKLDLTGEQGGLSSLSMRQSDMSDRPPGGHLNVTVEPSSRVGGGQTGIYVAVNDHYEINDESPQGRGQLFDLLKQHFETSLRRAEDIVDHVMSMADSR